LKLALKEGPEYMNKTRATGLIREDGQIKGVKAKIDEREDVEIRSKIVIGADGIESKVGRWAGIYKALDVNDLVVNLDSIVEVDMGEEESYTWHRYYGYGDIPNLLFESFPKGDGRVSLSAISLFHPSAPKKGELINGRNYILKNNPLFSKSKLIEVGGGCNLGCSLKNFVADGVMLIGEAARQTNLPLAAAGILHAMDAGVLAGETAVESHEEGDFSSNLLSRYEQRYYRLHGEQDFLGYLLVRGGLSFSAEDINIVFHLLGESDTATFTDKIFETFAQPKFTSKLIYKLKKEGLEIPDMLSLASLLKKYHRNYWDLFVE
jgi:Dehydrogenases (flavoproteins)